MGWSKRQLFAAVLLVAPRHPARADAISSFCQERGGTLATATNDVGRPTELCVLKDGTRMNAIAFFRNQHRTLR